MADVTKERDFSANTTDEGGSAYFADVSFQTIKRMSYWLIIIIF